MEKGLSCHKALGLMKDYFSGTTQKELVKTYGISEKAVYNILYLVTYVDCTKDFVNSCGGYTTYLTKLAQRKQQGLGRYK